MSTIATWLTTALVMLIAANILLTVIILLLVTHRDPLSLDNKNVGFGG